jgi:hypothetical protein
MDKYVALMETPNETFAVGLFDDADKAGDWGIANETDLTIHRGVVRCLPRANFIREHKR